MTDKEIADIQESVHIQTAKLSKNKIIHSHNEKLDAILTVLNNASIDKIKAKTLDQIQSSNDILTEHNIAFKVIAIGFKDIDLHEIKLMLPYLISENHIEFKDNGYKIRYNGKVFIENGGFNAPFIKKWEIWIKEPDNQWKIIVFFLSPVVSFLVGYYLGKHF